MRHAEPDLPGSEIDAATTEERLRRENQELKRQIDELKGSSHSSSRGGPSVKLWNPSGVTIWSIVLLAAVLLVVAFLAGYIPLQKRRALIVSEAQQQEEALPRVEVVEVGRSSRTSEMELPGNIQAITEAPILARADGYLQRRMADIGDRVRSGQPLAEIEAPELDDQVHQAKANLQQARAALDQALANYTQGKSNMEFARVTAERWGRLVARGAVSKQENDQYQAQYQAQAANLQALEKAIAAQRSTVSAVEANLARLEKLQGYLVVKAPFDGVITLRNLDAGALVTCRKHASVSHRTDGHAPHLRQRPASHRRLDPARANGAFERFEFARPRVQGRRGAHRERARSQQQDAPGGSSRAQCGWGAVAGHVRSGRFE